MKPFKIKGQFDIANMDEINGLYCVYEIICYLKKLFDI